MKMTDSSGKIITFYSYKGGTGRSMTLANVAWILASNGKRVLAADWDLEAPGLHRYFYPFLVDKDLTSSEGVIDFVIDFAVAAMTPTEKNEGLPKDWYIPHANILRYAASLDREFPNGGTLDFVPSGRQGPSYSMRVNSFNWQNFYDRLGGGVFLEAVKEKMRAEYDYILIDSRTGVSDTSGICTVQMPDILVVCFTLNNQSIEGAAAVATSVYEQRKKSGLRIFPVPMRIENAEKEKLDRMREYAKKKFAPFLEHIRDGRWEQYWGEVEVLYIPFYAYEEIIATFGDRPGQTNSLLASAERLTNYLTNGEVRQLALILESDRQEILVQYARLPKFLPIEEQIRVAESVFARFTPEEQIIAQRVFTRLVWLARPEEGGKDSRKRIKLSDLDPSTNPVVQALADARLVEKSRDKVTNEETLELVHEELIQGWQRLKDWINKDRVFLLWRQYLGITIAEWEKWKQKRSQFKSDASILRRVRYLFYSPLPSENSILLPRALLGEAKRWASDSDHVEDLNISEREFINISKSVRVQVRRRIADVVLPLTIMILLVLSTLWWQQCQSKVDRANAILNAATASEDSLEAVLLVAELEGLPEPKDGLSKARRIASQDFPISILRGHTDWVTSAMFSPDGKFIVTASDDKTVLIWDASTGKSVTELLGHTSVVNSAMFSPDGKFIVTASDDKTVLIWDASTGKDAGGYTHTGVVNSAMFSPDGKFIVTAREDGTARVWDDRTLVTKLRGHISEVNSAMFSPDGKFIVTASDDKTARVWDASTGKSMVELRGHTGEVYSAAFSPDGKFIVTASEDRTARIWDVSTGKSVTDPIQDLDWKELVKYLRNSTNACLTTEQRGRLLGESESEARAAYEACERRHGRTPLY